MKIFKLLVLSLLAAGCNVGTGHSLPHVEPSEITYAEIKEKPDDSLAVPLNAVQIKNFADIVNSAEPAKMMKAGPKYWLFVKFRNDSVKTYKITNHLLGENDVYIELGENNFLQDIYRQNPKVKATLEPAP